VLDAAGTVRDHDVLVFFDFRSGAFCVHPLRVGR
jgi:hypothetical protein